MSAQQIPDSDDSDNEYLLSDDGSDLSELDDTPCPRLPLKHEHTLYLSRRIKKSYTFDAVASFCSVADFWSVWNFVRAPDVDTIAVFREDCRPLWEDSPHGGRLIFAGGDTGREKRFELFTQLVLGVIGGTLDQYFTEAGDELCGVVLTKYKLEIWNASAGSAMRPSSFGCANSAKLEGEIRKLLSVVDPSLGVGAAEAGGSGAGALLGPGAALQERNDGRQIGKRGTGKAAGNKQILCEYRPHNQTLSKLSKGRLLNTQSLLPESAASTESSGVPAESAAVLASAESSAVLASAESSAVLASAESSAVLASAESSGVPAESSFGAGGKEEKEDVVGGPAAGEEAKETVEG